MNILIEEAAPGRWRWIFVDAAGAMLAASRLFLSPAECWLSLVQVGEAAAHPRVH